MDVVLRFADAQKSFLSSHLHQDLFTLVQIHQMKMMKQCNVLNQHVMQLQFEVTSQLHCFML